MGYGKSGQSRLSNRHVQRPISNGLKKNENMYEWLKEQTWSDFAKSLSEYYVTYSGFTENQLKSAIKMRKKVDKFYDPSGASVENGVYMDGLNKEIYKLSWVVEGDFKSRSLRKRRIDSPTWFEVKNGYSRSARDDFFTNVANGNFIKLTEEGIIKIGKNRINLRCVLTGQSENTSQSSNIAKNPADSLIIAFKCGRKHLQNI
jgi:hypothetical protein